MIILFGWLGIIYPSLNHHLNSLTRRFSQRSLLLTFSVALCRILTECIVLLSFAVTFLLLSQSRRECTRPSSLWWRVATSAWSGLPLAALTASSRPTGCTRTRSSGRRWALAPASVITAVGPPDIPVSKPVHLPCFLFCCLPPPQVFVVCLSGV